MDNLLNTNSTPTSTLHNDMLIIIQELNLESCPVNLEDVDSGL
jgi:hypothetical protein